MTIEEMKARKRELNLTNREISEKSGVPLGTVQKVFSGHTASPRYETLLALEMVLKPPVRRVYSPQSGEEKTAVREASAAYVTPREKDSEEKEKPAFHEKKQGEYRVSDYLALPEERRCELINGVLYDMAAPTKTHQLLCGEIFSELRRMIREKNGCGRFCIPFIAPCDVYLLCGDRLDSENPLSEVPNLVIEVLSRSTRRKDMTLKPYKYANAGVEEYWIVDPKKQIVLVFDFRNDDAAAQIYPFASEIPIGISGGACSLNMAEIDSYIRGLRENGYLKPED